VRGQWNMENNGHSGGNTYPITPMIERRTITTITTSMNRFMACPANALPIGSAYQEERRE
jgi:hypothetical protein